MPKASQKKMTYSEYIKSLQYNKLDSSDVILLSLQILKSNLKNSELEDLKSAYIEGNYSKAKNLLVSILKTHKQSLNEFDPSLISIIKDALSKTVDVPEHNVSRRYFETRFSADMWQSLNKNDLASINDLLATIKRVNDSEPSEEKKLQSLPEKVTNIDQAYRVISTIRDFGDNNSSMLAIRTPLRRESPLPKTKDRWDDNPKPDTQYSMNPGIMRANNPMPVDERLGKQSKNRTTDTFYINRGLEAGFSATRENVPFVNSVSGTAFSMVVAIKLYLEDQKQLGQKSQAQLNSEVNAIVHAFLGYTCMNGYHSLGEMTEVLKEPAVEKLLGQYGVSINKHITSNNVDEVLEGAAFYTNELIKRQLMQSELRKSPMTFKLDDKKSKETTSKHLVENQENKSPNPPKDRNSRP